MIDGPKVFGAIVTYFNTDNKRHLEFAVIINTHTSTSCKRIKPSSVPSATILPSGLQQIDVMHFPANFENFACQYLSQFQRKYNRHSY
jgi:hypothetical protein